MNSVRVCTAPLRSTLLRFLPCPSPPHPKRTSAISPARTEADRRMNKILFQAMLCKHTYHTMQCHTDLCVHKSHKYHSSSEFMLSPLKSSSSSSSVSESSIPIPSMSISMSMSIPILHSPLPTPNHKPHRLKSRSIPTKQIRSFGSSY